MASQLDRDWEEQQHGLQGTVTGSLHNQIGLDSRPAQPDATDYSRPRQRTNAKRNNPAARAEQPDHPAARTEFSLLMALIGFAAACYWLYDPLQESAVPMLIGGAIGGALAGRFYKVILGLALAVGALYAFGVYSG